jgi:ParB/RepB/Spo0J family partition protein
MNKISSGEILLKNIKHIENSRLRNKDDVSDLMNDIKQHGLLQPIGIRISDNALIYGNRRVKAYKNLEYDKIQCDFYSDESTSNNDLLIMNIVENIKRNDIGSIEIGRIVKLLIENGLTKAEISAKLGIPKSRVDSCYTAYKVTINTPFQDLVTFTNSGKVQSNKGIIPEGLIWKIQTVLTRGLGRKLTDDDWIILLNAIEQEKLNTKNIRTLRTIMSTNKRLSLQKAIDILDKTKTLYIDFSVNKEEMN